VSNLLYLGFAVVLSIVGGTLLYLRTRKPTSLNAGIEEFQRELRALAPDKRPDGQGQGQGQGRTPGPR
jgi:hypothetical protein